MRPRTIELAKGLKTKGSGDAIQLLGRFVCRAIGHQPISRRFGARPIHEQRAGFVLDRSGAVTAGATVSLRNAATGVRNSMKTGDGGSYRFTSLPPGSYVVSVEASGFKKREVPFTLSTGETQGSSLITGTTTNCDFNNDGALHDIPNKPSADFTGSHSRQAYINGIFTASDFPVPAAGAEGNLLRNISRNPRLLQVDASVLKNNHLPWLGEQGNLEFRFDFLNLFKHANLGAVDSNLADATFGRVTSALSARQIQLGLRVSF